MFLRPEYFLLLLLWLPLSFFLIKKKQTISRWQSVIAPELLTALAPSPTKKQQQPWLIPLLGLLIITALAGPSITNGNQHTASNGNLFILLDNSLSMSSPDVTPSRLVRAKRLINDWTRSGLFDKSSVIVYSASAHTLTPLTSDSDTINTQLQAVDPFLMPQFGNQPQYAFELLQQTLENLSSSANHLLWLTDDVDQADVDQISQIDLPFASKTLIPIGTAEGGVMPLPNKQGPLKDSSGNAIVTRLNNQQITQAANTLGFSVGDVNTQPNANLFSRLDSIRAEHTGRADIGYFLLIPIALIFLWRNSQHSLVTCFVFTSLFIYSKPSFASELFQNSNQRAYQALLDGDADKALSESRSPDISAQALYEQQDFDNSADLFKQLNTADGFYNAANAKVQLGQFEEALSLYDQAIELSNHPQAQYNKEKVEDFLKQQQKSGEQGDSQQQEPQEGNEENNEGSNGQTPQGNNQSDSDSVSPPSEPQESENEQNNESAQNEGQSPETEGDQEGERSEPPQNGGQPNDAVRTEQAIESVLNQLESDPGSLLQRKFRYQFQQNPIDTDTLEW